MVIQVDGRFTIVRETNEPGMSVSLVARKHGINANQRFHRRNLERIGSLTAVEAGGAKRSLALCST